MKQKLKDKLKDMVPNMYPATVKKEDADTTRLGKGKTGLYFLTMFTAVVGVALFNGTRSTVISETVGSLTSPVTATQCKVYCTLLSPEAPTLRMPASLTGAPRGMHALQYYYYPTRAGMCLVPNAFTHP